MINMDGLDDKYANTCDYELAGREVRDDGKRVGARRNPRRAGRARCLHAVHLDFGG
jgi:hypothetical protein